MNNVLYLLDVNVAANAGGNLGGVYSTSEWLSRYPDASWGIQVINRAVALNLPLVASQPFAVGLEKTLRKEAASDFEALDAESARATAASYLALVHASSGALISRSEIRENVASAKRTVSLHLQGNARGQIDHEDATIIASAMAALRRGRKVKRVVIVTDDRGLQNCARDLAPVGIAVLSPDSFLALSDDRFSVAG